MAANPKPPLGPRPVRSNRPQDILTPKPKSWWPLILSAIAIAVLIGLIIWLASSPSRPKTSVAPQTSVSGLQIRLTNLATSVPTKSGQMDLTGKVVNDTGKSVVGISVKATFRNITGETLQTTTEQLSPNPTNGSEVGFQSNPIAPGAAQGFAIYFQRVPEGWNRDMPDLQITNVQTTGH